MHSHIQPQGGLVFPQVLSTKWLSLTSVVVGRKRIAIDSFSSTYAQFLPEAPKRSRMTIHRNHGSLGAIQTTSGVSLLRFNH